MTFAPKSDNIVYEVPLKTKTGTTTVISPKSVGKTTVIDHIDNSKGATLQITGGLKGAKEEVHKISNTGTVVFGQAAKDAKGLLSDIKDIMNDKHSNTAIVTPKTNAFNSGIFKKDGDSNPFNQGIFKKDGSNANPFNTGIFKNKDSSNPFNSGIFKKDDDSNPFNKGIFKTGLNASSPIFKSIDDTTKNGFMNKLEAKTNNSVSLKVNSGKTMTFTSAGPTDHNIKNLVGSANSVINFLI